MLRWMRKWAGSVVATGRTFFATGLYFLTCFGFGGFAKTIVSTGGFGLLRAAFAADAGIGREASIGRNLASLVSSEHVRG